MKKNYINPETEILSMRMEMNIMSDINGSGEDLEWGSGNWIMDIPADIPSIF